jgi:hypothetical protein
MAERARRKGRRADGGKGAAEADRRKSDGAAKAEWRLWFGERRGGSEQAEVGRRKGAAEAGRVREARMRKAGEYKGARRRSGGGYLAGTLDGAKV